MNKGLLNLKPKRYLCPYCGKWHEWVTFLNFEEYNLGFYNDQYNDALVTCDDGSRLRFVFCNDYCYCRFDKRCNNEFLGQIKVKIPISSIIESKDKPIVTFEVTPFTIMVNENIGGCSDCDDRTCMVNRLTRNGNKPITLGFEFEESDYNKYADVKNLDRSCEEQKLLKLIDRAIHEEEDAEVNKEQVSQQPQVKENKEDTTMANNIFNMNMEFGPNKDENIASTLMGVAVKNGDSWRIYDKKKKEITDVGDMQLGNLPIFILPTTKLTEGDLIKDSGEYYFVTKVATVKTPTQTLSVRTGELKSIVPIKNILGFSCYSKVIAFSDSLDTEEDFDMEKLAIMSAMCGQTSEASAQMNQMLPLMLFKDKLGGDDNMMNMLLMSSMMTPGNDGNQMNQMLPLMLFKDKLGGDDNMMKMLLMSSMMGGDMAGSNNPMMNYLMLDSFMGKKDSKVPQSDDGTDK